jgi:type VI secretion system protein ImpL
MSVMKLLRGFYLWLVLFAIGLLAVCLLVALGGPLLSIGGRYPLESDLVRYLVVAAIALTGLGFGVWLVLRRRASAAAIEAAIAQNAIESDEKVLSGKMKEALATLKAAGGDKADYLYDLPWYVIIGPPGSGKTTALVNSGLKFPLSAGATPAAIAGSGGTRYCDWWFTEDAVLIDTAGRYTTQDSDKTADSRSWLAFLDLLKAHRPHQPINGVIVAISLEDVVTAKPDELQAHADAIRSRLIELHDRLKVDFPVYALFTKTDLLAGFGEFFASFDERLRRQVWGATFKVTDKSRSMLGDVPTEFDALLLRLNELVTDRLQEEPTPSTRVALFGFPAQMASLRKPVHDFLNRIFEPTRYHANAVLRGFYFTSGTQQGTPIDRLIGTLTRNFGGREVKGVRLSRLGKSYFLADLIGRTIIGEANWVSTDAAAVRRERLVKIAGLAALGALCAASLAAWSVSFVRNKSLITSEEQAVSAFTVEAGAVIRQTRIASHDMKPVLPVLNKLRAFPTGYATRDTATSMTEGFGLSQRERLTSTAINSYRVGLERLFRPRIIYRLEEALEQSKDNPNEAYEALKVYLMLTGSPRMDQQLVSRWLEQDWAALYPGAAEAAGRATLLQHLQAMFDLADGREPLVGANDDLVKATQRSLARLSVSQRAYALLKSQAGTAKAPDWIAAAACGEDVSEVFTTAKGERADAIRVPGFYTYAGFHRAFLERLSGIEQRLAQDRWVLGPAGEQSEVAAQYQTLNRDLRTLYAKDFVEAWSGMLSRLKLKSFVADKPRYTALAVAAGVTSPFKCVLEQLRAETAVTREREGFKADDKKKAGEIVGDASPGGAPVGAEIETAFKPYHLLVEGDQTRRPVDAIVGGISDINQSIILSANPAQAEIAKANLIVQVETMRRLASRLPPPFSAMLLGAAAEFDNDVTTVTHMQLRQLLGNQVTGVCNQIIANAYPFARTSIRDVALQDFGRLFGTAGVLDRYFATYLAQYVDMSRGPWAWRQDSALGKALSASPDTLRPFQQAARIREVYLASGGAIPNLTLSITPPPLQQQVQGFQLTMDANGTPVTATTASPHPPVVTQWPGANSQRSAVMLTDGGQTETFERTGAWSLFRLVEGGAPIFGGNLVQVKYVFSKGQVVAFRIAAGTSQNPFDMALLRSFQCPSGL